METKQNEDLMEEKPFKNIFVEGAIPPSLIAESVAKHSSKTSIGAHAIFLGQVRADEIAAGKVTAIDYTAYEEMALKKMHEIRERIFEKYSITCIHVYHSLGRVQAGAICLFVFASSPHRKACTEACNEMVEKIKSELPIWGKEITSNDSYQWKLNT